MNMPPPGKKLNYLLRDIPPSLWRRAKHVTIEEDITLRQMLLDALEDYCNRERNTTQEVKKDA